MIPEVFLVCALSLPVVSCSADRIAEELRHLREFIHHNVPGAEVVLTVYDNDMTRAGMERLPFKWREMNIWIKRPTVRDTPPINRRSA